MSTSFHSICIKLYVVNITYESSSTDSKLEFWRVKCLILRDRQAGFRDEVSLDSLFKKILVSH